MRRENPVFWYHLVGQSRYRWRKQRALTLISSVLITLIYLYLLQQTIKYEIDPNFVQILGLLLVCLFVPLGCYALFSVEYEKATWESLAITPLTVDEIVFGKWFSRVLGVLVLALVIAPISFIAWAQATWISASLIDWLGSMWLLISWGVLLVSMGMWISLRVRHSIASASLLYGIQVFALLFLPLLTMLLMELAARGVRIDMLPVEASNPSSLDTALRFWLTLPFDWRCLFILNPFIATEQLLTQRNESLPLLYGWGQGFYYWLFSGLFYLLTRQGVRYHWRK